MEDKLIEILKRYSFNEALFENIKPESDLKNDLSVNSGRIMDIVLDIEEEFGIEINDEEINNIRTYGDILAKVNSGTN